MTDERLKEIKDSIDLQLEVAKHIDVHNVLALEEKELYDYAKSLKERVSYLEKSIVRKEETITELEQESVPYTNEYVDKVAKENEELKKQLEETDRKLFLTKNELDMRQKTIDNKLNQQQEFINWLEAEIKSYEAISDLLFNHNKELKVYKEVLAKCKETIGENKDE